MWGLKVCTQLKEKWGTMVLRGLVKPREPEANICPDWGPKASVARNHLNSVKKRSLSRGFQSRRREASLPWKRLSSLCCLESVMVWFSKDLVARSTRRVAKVPACKGCGDAQQPSKSPAKTPMLLPTALSCFI